MPDYQYTPRLMQGLAEHYYDDRHDVETVDIYTDFAMALSWLERAEPTLHQLLLRYMTGEPERELALVYALRPRTLARLLDQTFTLLARYLNDEWPLDIPHIEALKDAIPLDSIANDGVHSQQEETDDR